MEEREVDIALEMCGEPGLEGCGIGGLTLAVEVCEDGKGTSEDTNVGEGHGEHHPVDHVEWPHGECNVRVVCVVEEGVRRARDPVQAQIPEL